MRYDEFAFFNEQLANMLRDGIPLEGALKQLCRDLRHGALSAELEAISGDLARGVPLEEALAHRRLPDLYVRMVSVGTTGNNLPGVLQMLADHYRQVGAVIGRLKGLLIYPAIVLIACLGLSLFVAFRLGPTLNAFAADTLGQGLMGSSGASGFGGLRVALVPAVVAVLLCGVLVAQGVPGVRRWIRWRWAPFKAVSLAQMASALSLMLRGGCRLEEALALVGHIERGTAAESDIGRLSRRLENGHANFEQMADGSRVFPPLFIWMVQNGGEDLASGLSRAAELYRTRASHQTEMLLYAALPCSILALGAVLFAQVTMILGPLLSLLQNIGQG